MVHYSTFFIENSMCKIYRSFILDEYTKLYGYIKLYKRKWNLKTLYCFKHEEIARYWDIPVKNGVHNFYRLFTAT